MNVANSFVCLGLSLTLVVPAFCGPQAAIVGKWEGPPYAPGHSNIYEYKADGKVIVSTHDGTTVKPIKLRGGKPLILKYATIGNKVTITYPNLYRTDQWLFIVQRNRLTLTKGIKLSGPPNHGQMRDTTLTRYKD